MYRKADFLKDLSNLKIDSKGTLLVHSSYKSVGPVEGGPATVLDALSEYMSEGLLALPTHTWEYINAENPRYFVDHSPSNVGILTELFRRRPGVIRSHHPTHSVGALGRDAEDFVSGDEKFDTPCARFSAWGKLMDRRGQIMMIGVDLTRNTFMHGVEEWADIPGRMTDDHENLITVLEDGSEIKVPSRRHSGLIWSDHFWKVEDIFIEKGIMQIGKFGDAETRIIDAHSSAKLLFEMLRKDPDLFSDNEPLKEEFINFFD